MRKIASLLTVLTLLCTLAYGQTVTVKGTVKNDKGEVIPFATVTENGTKNGTTATTEGVFSLTIKSGSKITISATNHESVVVTPSGGDVNVTLKPTVGDLAEVVVTTALGVNRSKKSIGYATQQVSGEKLNQTKVVDLNTAIAGKVSGVQIRGGSGAKFGTSTIHLRGINSLSGGTPIYVVDGVILTNANGINPDDVETLNVLKGPAATALYGQRGSEGALVITTKKGTKKGVGIEFNHTTTFEKVYVLPNYQNEYGGGNGQPWRTYVFNPAADPAYLSVLNGAKYHSMDIDESWGPRMDGTLYAPWYAFDPSDPDFGKLQPFNPQPDNVKDFFNTGVANNTTVAFSKVTNESSTRLSFSNLTRTGVIPNSNQQKNWLSLNNILNLTSKFTVSTNVNYVYEYLKNVPQEGYSTQTTGSFNQWFHRDIEIDKLKRYQRPDGTFTSWNISGPTNVAPKYWDNPYTEVYENVAHNYIQRVYGSANASYKILPGLKLSAIARATITTTNSDDRTASFTLVTPAFSNAETKYKETSFLGAIEYDKTFGNFSVRAGAFGELNKVERNDVSTATNGGFILPNVYNVSNSLNEKTTTNFISLKKVNSLYGYANVGYNDLVFLDLTIRNDMSSALPAANNSYVYGSASGSFVFTQLMKNKDILSFGKLRASIARIGTDIDPYRTTETFALGTNYVKSVSAVATTYSSQTVPNGAPGVFLTPTLSTSIEFGTELQFLRNRIRFDFNYYKRDAKDQILNITTPGSIGYNSILGNAGNIRNWGYEFTLGGSPVRSKDWSWDADFNLAINKNEVVDLDEGLTNLQVGLDGSNISFGFSGSPAVSLNARVGQPYGLIVGNGIQKDANGNRLVGDDGYYLTEDNMEIGNLLPKFTGGFSNAVSYKNLFLNFTLDFQKGGQFVSTTKMFNYGSGLSEETAGLNDKGNPKRDAPANGGGVRLSGVNATTGKENDVYVETRDLYESYLFSVWENWVYDASFIKLREVSLGYNIPKSVYKRLPFQNVSVSLIGQNLWLIASKVKGLDPSELEQSWMEGGQLPGTRSMGINVKIGF